MTENKTEIERDLLERLITKFLLEAAAMDHTIEIAGDHYTYRDKQRFCHWAAQELEQEHLYLLKYHESAKRLREIRNKVVEEVSKLYGN